MHATLTAASSGVTITRGSADLGTLAPGASANAAFGVQRRRDRRLRRGRRRDADDHHRRRHAQSFPVSLPVGAGRSGAFTQAVPAPGTIPANYTASLRDLTSSQTVTTPGRIGTLRVTLAATHSLIGDLHATLTHS